MIVIIWQKLRNRLSKLSKLVFQAKTNSTQDWNDEEEYTSKVLKILGELFL